MREVLHLHAGFHKTGSTAIQDYLFNHEPGPGYSYFHAGMANSSLIILQAFKRGLADEPQFRHKNLTPQDVSRIRQRARERIAGIVGVIDQPHTILSAEAIGSLNPGECAELYDFFKGYYREIRVYLYVRPLKSRMESAFQEVLKTRFRDLQQPFPFNFERSIGKFDQVFGEDRVKVNKFARGNFADGNVVKHFLGQVGINPPCNPGEQANTSLSRPAIELLYVYRRFFPRTQEGDAERLRKLGALPGGALHFHSELLGKLLINHEGDSRWMENRVDFSIGEDIEAHDHSAIRSEEDLSAVSPEAIAWLKAQQPSFLSRLRVRRRNLRSIADGVRRLSLA